jgi:hypothetical protein
MSGSHTEVAPEALASALVCLLPGYILEMTIRGADAVKAIPDAVRGLIAED